MSNSHETTAFLKERHSEYQTRRFDWQFFMQSYIGGRQYLDGSNMFGHRLEHRSDAARRLERSFYLNHCRNVVDITTALLFAKGFEIQPAPPEYLVSDADRRGNDLTQLLRRTSTLSSIYGHVFISVDVPRIDGDSPQSRRDELLMGIRPYFNLISPFDMLNWETDEGGSLIWCLTSEEIGRDVVEGGRHVVRHNDSQKAYRLWTQDAWYLYVRKQGEWKLADHGEHGLGVVPIVVAKHRDFDGGLCGESMLRDTAVINREIYNLSSLLQEILYRQTFGQLVAQGSADEYVGDEESLAILGTSSIFLYPDGRDAPSYISPNAANAEIVLTQIDRMVQEIYRISNLQPPDWLEPRRAPESGVARAYRFMNTNGALRDKADALSDALERALWIASLWEGEEREYTVTFPEQLGPSDT